MKQASNRYWSAAATALLAAVASVGGIASAQTDATTPSSAPAVTAGRQLPTRPIPAQNFNQSPAQDVAAKLGKLAGVTVLADSRIGLAPVTLQSVGGSLETVLAQVVERLPKGAVVRRVMLPAFAPGAELNADYIVAAYTAQERLVSTVMGSGKETERKPSDVNVLGKILPAAQAEAIVAALDLRPVYVLTNGNVADPVAKASELQDEGFRMWTRMTPEQRNQYMDHTFNSFLNMEPTSRQAFLGQMMQQGGEFMKRFQALPPDQRNRLAEEIKAALPPNLRGGGNGGGPGAGEPRP